MFSVGEVCYLFTVFEEISKIFQKININVSDVNNKGHGTSVNLNKSCSTHPSGPDSLQSVGAA